MSTTWKTKWGLRRVRVELPTLEEALDAAAGLTTGSVAQIELAASLMDQPVGEIKAAAERILRERARRPTTVLQPRAGRGAVIVERKPSRRLIRS